MTDLNTSLNNMDASLKQLRQTVESISNPKDLKRRWVITTWEDKSEGDGDDLEGTDSAPLVAGRLTSELGRLLEQNDGNTFVHFEIHPEEGGSNG